MAHLLYKLAIALYLDSHMQFLVHFLIKPNNRVETKMEAIPLYISLLLDPHQALAKKIPASKTSCI